MKTDPLVEAIRKARHEISKECGHDPYRLVAYYQARERRLRAEGKRLFVDVSSPAAESALREEPPAYTPKRGDKQ
jgi:hypothetical protein